MAKKTSKRCSERRKTKTVITNARKEAKLRRELNKNKKNSIRVPKSVLMTDEEKLHLQNIKESSALRAKQIKVVETEETKCLKKMEDCIKSCDCFLEVVDFRDIEGTKNSQIEELLESKKIEVYVYINFMDSNFKANFSDLKNLKPVTDFLQFKNFKKICIFGKNKVGKFLVSKNIESVCGQKDFQLIKTPLLRSTVSEVFRGIVDLKNINPKNMFCSLYEFLEKKELQEYYRIANFTTATEFLELLSKRISAETMKAVSQEESAMSFFKDVKSGQINWVKQSNRFIFKFINKNQF